MKLNGLLFNTSRSSLTPACRYLLISFVYVTSSFIFIKVGFTVMIPEVQLRTYNQLPVTGLTEASSANQSTFSASQRLLATGSSSYNRLSRSGNAPFSDRLVVHVTWFYKPHTEFRFHEALCLLAIQRFVQPRKILFWYDAASTLPIGAWWQFARQSVAHLLPVPIDRPTAIFNISVDVPEHQSDIARLAILEEHGGLYVDLDLIIVRPIDELIRRSVHDTTTPSELKSSMLSSETEPKAAAKVVMGAETPEMLGSGFILAPQPGADFIRLWRRAYSDGFEDTDWNRHSVYVPMKLAQLHPHLIHVEWFAINRPNWYERDWLYGTGRLWDWSVNYAVHLWYRDRPRDDPDYDPVTIRQLNTTVGEVFRLIYYGHPRLLPPLTTSAREDGV